MMNYKKQVVLTALIALLPSTACAYGYHHHYAHSITLSPLARTVVGITLAVGGLKGLSYVVKKEPFSGYISSTKNAIQEKWAQFTTNHPKQSTAMTGLLSFCAFVGAYNLLISKY